MTEQTSRQKRLTARRGRRSCGLSPSAIGWTISLLVHTGSAAVLIISPPPVGSSFTDLTQRLPEILQDQHRTLDDPVKLVPTRSAKWDHVVKTYDALWRLNLTNIIFTFVDG